MIIILFIFGVLCGALVNWFVDRFGWSRKFRSPWSGFPDSWKNRIKLRRIDYFPIIGWFSIRKSLADLFSKPELEVTPRKKRKKFPSAAAKEDLPPLPGIESRFFWIRPLTIEIGLGLLAVFLYQIEVVQQGMSLGTLYFYDFNRIAVPMPNYSEGEVTALFLMHFLFCVFMLVATLTDFDDYIISDALVIPGTLIGIFLGTFVPGMVYVPFHYFCLENGQTCFYNDLTTYIQKTHPDSGWLSWLPLVIMIGAWTLWCFALLDRRFYLRLGVKKALILFFRVLKRSKLTILLSVIFPMGILLITWIYFANPKCCFSKEGLSADVFGGISPRMALFNILVSLTIGLMMVWIVRLIGRFILHREAMGFGDVMLMGMIGVYLGWQGTFIAFFIAPLVGIVFGLIRICCGMERQIPYGPFLCLGAFLFMLFRVPIWRQIEFFFSDPTLIAIISAVCVVLFAVLLYMLELVKKFVFRLLNK